MASTTTLRELIGTNREELIRRCKAKATARSPLPAAATAVNYGIPLFLDQLVNELGDGPSKTQAIKDGASQHGHNLLMQGLTVSQVVHDYGDVCQSVTDLAVELAAPISTDDFRTLNRCLDDAIADAVTRHASDQKLSRDGESSELRALLIAAITAFEVLQTGSVGAIGRTASIVSRNLVNARDLVDSARAKTVGPR
jgi:hypothetical protein